MLLVSMSVFSLAVLATLLTGLALGLYNKYKHPEDRGGGQHRPRSRTGTIDSRRSTGSRRSQVRPTRTIDTDMLCISCILYINISTK